MMTNRHPRKPAHGRRTGFLAVTLSALIVFGAAGPLHPSFEPGVAAAQSESGFRAWIRDFKQIARSEGISGRLLDEAFENVSLNSEVIRLDNYQPEFVRPIWEYIEARTDPESLSLGHLALRQHRSLLADIERRYGVQPEYVMAIWRLESFYGRYLGSFNIVEALATLGYAGRRREFWRSELINALRIVEQGYAPLSRLNGSWAGAMGHTQFMPSSYLRRAVDYDGDGQRDVWGSLGDVFASTANYLREAGWERGQPFGYEIRLPDGFNYTEADNAIRKTAAQWRARGVRLAGGEALPDYDGEGAILLPAGFQGPAFLVLNNYRVILRYNNATAYALTIGVLAERLRGGPMIAATWPVGLQPLSREEKEDLQRLLAGIGFDPGPIDGKVGPSTRAAIRRYQQHVGEPADGFASKDLLAAIRRRAGSN